MPGRISGRILGKQGRHSVCRKLVRKIGRGTTAQSRRARLSSVLQPQRAARGFRDACWRGAVETVPDAQAGKALLHSKSGSVTYCNRFTGRNLDGGLALDDRRGSAWEWAEKSGC